MPLEPSTTPRHILTVSQENFGLTVEENNWDLTLAYAAVSIVPNSVTSETTSDGTAELDVTSLTADNITANGVLDANDINGALRGNTFQYVRTGGSVSKGDPVYIHSYNAGSSLVVVRRADASDPTKMPAIGIMDANYSLNYNNARCLISGNLEGLDTSIIPANAPIYVADGGGTSTTAGTISQVIARCLRSDPTGSFLVTPESVITNAVTSETTSDGTANLEVNNLSTLGNITLPPQNDEFSHTANWEFTTVPPDDDLGGNPTYLLIAPYAAGNIAVTGSVLGIPDKLTDGTIAGTLAINSTTITYGTGAAAAHRTALGLGTLATQSGTFSGTSSGTNTGDQTTVSGNAGTATALQTSRNIFGLAFNGTANVAGDATNTGHFASIPTGGAAGHFVTLNGTSPTVIAGRSAWWSDGSGNPSFRNGTGTAITLVKSSDLGTDVATALGNAANGAGGFVTDSGTVANALYADNAGNADYALYAESAALANEVPLGGITGLGTGVATFLATPSSANLLAAVTDETGSGSLVFATSPTITTPTIAQINGGTAANDDLTLQGTTNATRTTSYVNLQPNGGNVGIGTTSPSATLHTIALTEQMRIGYNAANYTSLTVSSAGNVTHNNTGTFVSQTLNGSQALYQGFSSSAVYMTIGGTTRGDASLGKFNIFGTTGGSDAPILVIWQTTDDSAAKNAGLITKTRMTNRYLKTYQTLGQNDNSFGNAGLIQFTAWEYSNNTYTTLATPTEFSGWNYQYYNGTAYASLLSARIAGVGVGIAAPNNRLHLHNAANNAGVDIGGATTANFTGVGFSPNVTTSVVARVAQGSSSGAGLALIGFSSVADNSGAVSIFAHSGVTAPTTPVIILDAYKHNGTTGRAALATTEMATQWRNGGSAVMTLLGGGNLGLGTTTPTAVVDINSDILRLRTAKTPASATAAGNAGDICWDASYIYVCTATNTWKRTLIATWV